jgi:DNA-directed RNA polymerase subunit H (RpoH/RPB5)
LVRRTCKGILQADNELTFESIQEEGPRIVINDPYSKKLNAPKTTKVIIERQSTESSPTKSKKYSARW